MDAFTEKDWDNIVDAFEDSYSYLEAAVDIYGAGMAYVVEGKIEVLRKIVAISPSRTTDELIAKFEKLLEKANAVPLRRD